MTGLVQTSGIVFTLSVHLELDVWREAPPGFTEALAASVEDDQRPQHTRGQEAHHKEDHKTDLGSGTATLAMGATCTRRGLVVDSCGVALVAHTTEDTCEPLVAADRMGGRRPDSVACDPRDASCQSDLELSRASGLTHWSDVRRQSTTYIQAAAGTWQVEGRTQWCEVARGGARWREVARGGARWHEVARVSARTHGSSKTATLTVDRTAAARGAVNTLEGAQAVGVGVGAAAHVLRGVGDAEVAALDRQRTNGNAR